MTYRIQYHQSFNEDMRRIRSWVAHYVGDDVARRKLSEIREAILGLKAFPNRGTVHDEFVPGLRLLPVGEQAIVTFVVDDEKREIYILAVTYAGGDWVSRSIDRS